mgnify:CR=1 FL=1
MHYWRSGSYVYSTSPSSLQQHICFSRCSKRRLSRGFEALCPLTVRTQRKSICVQSCLLSPLGTLIPQLSKLCVSVKSTFFYGWLFFPDESTVTDIQVLCGNHVIGSLKYGLQRDDVLRGYPNWSKAKYSGFEGHIRLPAKPYAISFRVFPYTRESRQGL